MQPYIQYKQTRGAGIGCQLSPALCNVTGALIEHAWQQLHNNLLHHTDIHFNYYRYVDNRFIIHNEHFLTHPAILTLIRHDFFGDPIELEAVEDNHLLGFNIELTNRTITYMQPTQSWKIRDPTSAGSKRLTLSGLASRLHTMYKYTFPPTAADAAADDYLVKLYIHKGHAAIDCKRFLKSRKSTLCAVRSRPSTGLTAPFRPLVCVRPRPKWFNPSFEIRHCSTQGRVTLLSYGQFPVPAISTVDPLRCSLLLMVVLHATPKQVSSSSFQQPSFSRVLQTSEQIV